MQTLEEIIRQANTELLSEIIEVAIQRYESLFPTWQIYFLAVEKGDHHNDQIDRAISLLEHMKMG